MINLDQPLNLHKKNAILLLKLHHLTIKRFEHCLEVKALLEDFYALSLPAAPHLQVVDLELALDAQFI